MQTTHHRLSRNILLRLLRASLCVYCLTVHSATLAETYAVISMNPDMPELSSTKARMIYTGKTKSLGNVGRVKLLDWPKGSEQRSAFYRLLTNRSESDINSQWASLAFSGKARPPREMSNTDESEIVSWLESNTKGIAYVPGEHIPDGAKVLLMVE